MESAEELRRRRREKLLNRGKQIDEGAPTIGGTAAENLGKTKEIENQEVEAAPPSTSDAGLSSPLTTQAAPQTTEQSQSLIQPSPTVVS